MKSEFPERHVVIRVTGKVQGVLFRASTKDTADQFGVKGFVQNESDGSVYIEAEGSHEDIGKLITWVTAGGPPRGKVETIRITYGAVVMFERFEIRR